MKFNFWSLTAAAGALVIFLSCPPHAEAQIQRVNLAKLQSATSDSVAAGMSAALATDGVVGTGTNNVWMSNGAGPHWLKIALPVSTQIGSAQLFFGIDNTLPVTNFFLQYFSSNSWVTIPGASFTGNTATVVNCVFSLPVTTSMIRFYSTDSTVMVREIALYAPNGPAGYPIGSDVTLSLAKNCTVIASSMVGPNYALRAVDGFAGTNVGWQTANANGPHTLEVDFPAAANIGSAQIYSGSAIYPVVSAFTLNYWNGSAWTAIPGATVSGNTQQNLSVTFSTPVSTTKVQLSIPGNGTQFVRELAVYAPVAGVTAYPLWTDVVSNDPPTTTWETYGDGYWSLVNQANSNALVVTATGASQAQVNAADPTQQFEVLYNINSDTFRLRHRSTLFCVAAQNAGTIPGTGVIEDPVYNAMPHELWRFQSMGGGYVRIVNVWSGLALQTDGQNPATVTLQAPSVALAQQWQISYQANYPKKGVAGNEANWALFGSSWDYNWSQTPTATAPAPAPVVFLPQQWNGGGVNNLLSLTPGWYTNPKPMGLLGFNEPDQTGQANMTVASAISLWPQLQATSVPLVGPATSWPTLSWMTSFWTQANANGYRIDESGVHWYSYPSADTFISTMQTVYSTWGRPVWITEFGVGFSGGSWSEEMNYGFLAEVLWRSENLSSLHRYGIFCFATNPPANTWDLTSPESGVFKSDGVTLTPFGQLYVSWDADMVIHTNTQYYLYNKGTYFRLNNPNGTSAGLASIRTNDLTVQWQLVASPTANQFYIVSLSGGQCLSCVGTVLSLAPAGTTGSAVQWTYTADSNGYYFIDNPAAGQRLYAVRSPVSGQPTTLAATTTASSTVNDTVRWRFIKPYIAAPTGLNVVTGTGQAFLSWNAVSGASSYNIKRAQVSGGPYTTLATGITSTNYTDTSLVNGAVYYYAVSTIVSAAESRNSAEAALPPGGIALNCGGSAAGWFQADANFSGGSSFSINSTIDTSAVATPAPQVVYQSDRFGTFTYTITNLTPSMTYWVRLHFAESIFTAAGQRVFNVSINGSTLLNNFDIFAAAGVQNRAVVQELYAPADGSGQLTIQFTPVVNKALINGIQVLPPAPVVPVGLSAAGDSTEVVLNWQPSAGAASYNIYRSSTSGGPYTLVSTPGTVTDVAYDDFTASPGSPGYYVVTAVNTYGESGNSTEVIGTMTSTCTPPAAPTAGYNSPIYQGMTLNLTASTLAGASYSWTGPNSFSSASQNPSIINATTAASGTYSVTATLGGCTSAPGTTTVTVNPPMKISIATGGGSIVISWPFGTLQTATNLAGPWSPIVATGSYTVMPSEPLRFYRIRLQ